MPPLSIADVSNLSGTVYVEGVPQQEHLSTWSYSTDLFDLGAVLTYLRWSDSTGMRTAKVEQHAGPAVQSLLESYGYSSVQTRSRKAGKRIDLRLKAEPTAPAADDGDNESPQKSAIQGTATAGSSGEQGGGGSQ